MKNSTRIARVLFHQIIFLCFVLLLTINLHSHITDEVFDDTLLREINLNFSMDNYWELLENNYQSGEHQYIPVNLEYQGQEYRSVGIRLKGNTSMFYPSNKKSFKIKFDAFVEDQSFYGLTKLNLNNAYKDPTFLREKILYDVMGNFIPCSRANFVKGYISRHYGGLVVNIGQIKMNFIEKNF